MALSFLPICQAPIGTSQRDINRGKPAAYIFAVMPALLLFAFMVFVPQHLHLALVIGFPMLLLVDRYFAHAGVTPHGG